LLGGYVRVYSPYQIVEGDNCVSRWRQRIDEYWVWDEGKDVLAKSKALECVIVADTMDGDEVVAHPTEPDRLYVLPRHDENIYVAGDGLMVALEWLMTSGVLADPIEDRTFEPFDGKAAPSTEEGDGPARAPTDLVGVLTSHHTDGRIICRVFRFGEEHHTEPWVEGSPLPVERAVVLENAARAAEAEFGEPARVDDLTLQTSTGAPSYYEASCLPVAKKGFGFLPVTIYLDLKGTVIAPTEHSFTDQASYEEFEDELYES